MKAVLSTCALATCLLGIVCESPLFAAGLPANGPAGPHEQSGTGFLDLSSEPPGAKILIDDADLGQRTPQHHLPVPSGHHRLTLVPTDGQHTPLTLGITVEAGETRKLTLYLQK
ncbi:MAG: PEGA domain-containing protein [Myxococcales bacterium]|nr:PEGA domain-containing protein [Myxococcales bacterium]